MRFLYIVDQSRVHIDRVLGLGEFAEIEVNIELKFNKNRMKFEKRKSWKKCWKWKIFKNLKIAIWKIILINQYLKFATFQVVLSDDETIEDGQKISEDLMGKLGIQKENLISKAYLDLLLAKRH